MILSVIPAVERARLRKERNWQRKTNWNPFFAWHPVRLLDGRWAWLQTVERISWVSSAFPEHQPGIVPDWAYRLPETP